MAIYMAVIGSELFFISSLIQNNIFSITFLQIFFSWCLVNFIFYFCFKSWAKMSSEKEIKVPLPTPQLLVLTSNFEQ